MWIEPRLLAYEAGHQKRIEIELACLSLHQIPIRKREDHANDPGVIQRQFTRQPPPEPNPLDRMAPGIETLSDFQQLVHVPSRGVHQGANERIRLGVESHLVVSDTDICATRCVEEYGNPCQYFCPAAVYEMVEGETPSGKALRINASNCVHCKTCDIMDPYEIITWIPPEGGGGPKYLDL